MPFSFSKRNLPKQLFINGEYVDSKHSKKLTLHNPKDGSLVTDDVALAGEQEVDAAVSAAEAAFESWRAVPAVKRRAILNKFADLLEEHTQALAELTRITLGAPSGTFGPWEVGHAVECFRSFAGWSDKFGGESWPQEDGFMKIVRNEPYGVTVGIAPWNGPMGGMGMKAGPALVTGNCFIFKPSEKTPFAALACGELIKQAGFPPGVFQILSGDGTTGALLASHMRVRKVSFTGSIVTGKRVQEAAAKSNLKRVTLELGGKSPAVIFEDCHLANAVKWTASGITMNTGQVCFAPTRVYVQESFFDTFIAAYKEALTTEMGKIGDPDDAQTEIGPLVDESQFKRVTGFIERGQQGQGELAFGGHRIGENGYYIEPTIFLNVAADAEIMQEEIFGPVVIVNTFRTEDEIVQKANDSEYGLMAGVFTQDINRALRIASRFESGMVGINCVSQFFQMAPFGGSKQSGIGRECGLTALRAFTEPKTIMVNLTY